ncbi:MAG: hypothetical protein WD066_04575 [Planctomycetaceae bacterium]
MPSVELSEEQVLELVRQLPPERLRKALLALAGEGAVRREQRLQYAEEQLRRVCSERGLDWDAMPENQREEFIDTLVHEDRPCRS